MVRRDDDDRQLPLPWPKSSHWGSGVTLKAGLEPRGQRRGEISGGSLWRQGRDMVLCEPLARGGRAKGEGLGGLTVPAQLLARASASSAERAASSASAPGRASEMRSTS